MAPTPGGPALLPRPACSWFFPMSLSEGTWGIFRWSKDLRAADSGGGKWKGLLSPDSHSLLAGLPSAARPQRGRAAKEDMAPEQREASCQVSSPSQVLGTGCCCCLFVFVCFLFSLSLKFSTQCSLPQGLEPKSFSLGRVGPPWWTVHSVVNACLLSQSMSSGPLFFPK